MLYKIEPSANYEIEINGTAAAQMHIAYLNASKYSKSQLGTSGIIISNSSLSNSKTFTITAWVNPNSYTANTQTGGDIYTIGPLTGSPLLNFYVSTKGKLAINDYNSNSFKNLTSSLNVSLNKWTFVAAELNNSNFTLYVNNRKQSGKGQQELGDYQSYIGLFYSGSLSNVQVYNSSLSAVQLQQLYTSGITSRITFDNLIGYWPLEGDANDYSNTHNTGYPYYAEYPYSSYIQPGLSAASEINSASTILPVSNYTRKNIVSLQNVGVILWS